MVLTVVGGGSGQIVPLILYSVQYIPWSWLWWEVAVDHRLAAPLTPPRPLATPSPPLSATPPPPPPAVGEKNPSQMVCKKKRASTVSIIRGSKKLFTFFKLTNCYETELMLRSSAVSKEVICMTPTIAQHTILKTIHAFQTKYLSINGPGMQCLQLLLNLSLYTARHSKQAIFPNHTKY